MPVFIPLISFRMSVGVMIPTSLLFSTTGSLWILFSEKIRAASAMGSRGSMVMQSLFMMRESWLSSKFLKMSLLETIPMSFPSEERTTGSPVSLFLTMVLITSLRVPGTWATMGAGVIMSATVFMLSFLCLYCHYGTLGAGDHVLGDATQDHLLDSGPACGTHDDKVVIA